MGRRWRGLACMYLAGGLLLAGCGSAETTSPTGADPSAPSGGAGHRKGDSGPGYSDGSASADGGVSSDGAGGGSSSGGDASPDSDSMSLSPTNGVGMS